VQINDYARARELFGLSLEEPDGQPKGLEEYLMEYPKSGPSFNMGGLAPWISGLWPNTEMTEPIHMQRHQYLGFDARNVDQTVLVGNSEPRQLEVLRGRFDPDATQAAIEACEGCPQPEVVEYLGVSYYTWGEDFATSAELQNTPPIFDRYGRGSSLVVQDGYVFRAVYREGVESMIAAQQDAALSLADVEDYRLLAAAMNALGAYSAFFSNDTMSPAPEEAPEMRQRGDTSPTLTERRQAVIAQGPLLRPYQTMAVGRGMDDDGRYLVIVLAHADEDTAGENVGRLQQRIGQTGFAMIGDSTWAEEVEEAEVWADGRLLIAKLRGERVSGFRSDLFTMEPLLVHE
jgi:hypothetical protein